jgi:hypothetical protein
MLRVLVYCLLAVLLFNAAIEKKTKDPRPGDSGNIRIAIIESEHGGYGYDIFVEEKLTIHQPHIPAISTIKGFATELDANKVAKTIAEKIRNNDMPPGITLEELIALDIRH